MGIEKFLMENFGVKIAMETLEQVDPILAKAVYLSDELTGAELIAFYLKESAKCPKEQPKVDWNEIAVQLLTFRPVLPVVIRILRKYGVREILGMDTLELLTKLASYKNPEESP